MSTEQEVKGVRNELHEAIAGLGVITLGIIAALKMYELGFIVNTQKISTITKLPQLELSLLPITQFLEYLR